MAGHPFDRQSVPLPAQGVLDTRGFCAVAGDHDARDHARAAAVAREVLQSIDRAVDTTPAPIQDVRVNHGRAHVPVPEQFLHRPNVIAILQEVSGE